MADTDNLDTAVSAILTTLASKGGVAKYNIDGQMVDYGELAKRLKELRALQAAIAGPFEVETVGSP
ncbi:MAG: hypothetical protein ACYS29_00930 [Planctomycetota bacterium]|jgi:hypothetical protein